MRTVKVSYDLDMGSGNRVVIETEAIVEDEDAHEAGREVSVFIARFNAGLDEGAAETNG